MKVWVIQRRTGCYGDHYTTPCQVVEGRRKAEKWIGMQLHPEHYIKTEWDVD